jgi:hypothetical protein
MRHAVDQPSEGEDLVKTIGLLLLVLASSAVASKTISETGTTGTWNCKDDPDVYFTISKSTYTVTGKCKSVDVTAGANKITIESVDRLIVDGQGNTITVGTVGEIEVNGDENAITWKKAKSGKAPTISGVGDKKKISQAK